MLNFNEIIDDIESLPPLSDTAKEIEKIFHGDEENISIIALVKVIESDVALTANILKILNAPIYGFSRQISSVSQAVTLLGTRMVYGIVMKFVVEQTIIANLRPYGVSAARFNNVSHLQSRFVSQWFSKIDLKLAQDLAPLALIMESGKLVVSKEIVKKGIIKQFHDALSKAPSELKYEVNTFGSSSYFISGLLFEHWNLDPFYVAVLKGLDFEREFDHPNYHRSIEILDITRTAINIHHVLSKDAIKEAAVLVKNAGLDVEHFIHTVKQMRAKLQGK